MSRAKKPKLGRPALEAGTARTAVFSFKLSEQERAELVQAAGAEPVTAWAREVLLAAARRGRTEGSFPA